MRTAVVFTGHIRCDQIARKTWHKFGNVDYFLITWDKSQLVRIHSDDGNLFSYGDQTPTFSPTQIDKFPVPITGSVISNYDEIVAKLGLGNFSFPYITYNWSKIIELPGIMDYDNIIITRPDVLLYSTDNFIINRPIPDKIHFFIHQDNGVKLVADLYIVTTPTMLHKFVTWNEESSDVVTDSIHTIHRFLDAKMNEPDSVIANLFELDIKSPTNIRIIRAGYDPTLETAIDLKPLFIDISCHGAKFAMERNPVSTYSQLLIKHKLDELRLAMWKTIK